MIKLPESIVTYYQKLHRNGYKGYVVKNRLYMIPKNEVDHIINSTRHRNTLEELATQKELITPIFVSCVILDNVETLVIE